MKVMTKTEMVEKVSEVYIAADGKEFTDLDQCIAYERDVGRKCLEKLRIEKMADHYPFSIGTYFSESSDYTWYKVKNESDFDLLQQVYGELTEPECYPEIICIEESEGDAYIYYLKDMREETESFWNNLGYKVILEKEEVRSFVVTWGASGYIQNFKYEVVAKDIETAKGILKDFVSKDKSLANSWDAAETGVKNHHGGYITWNENGVCTDKEVGCYKLQHNTFYHESDHLWD